MDIPDFGDEGDGSALYEEKKAVRQAKKAILMAAGAAAQKYMMELDKQQEILMNLADMVIDVFTAESTVLRTEKLIAQQGEEATALQVAMTKCYVNDAMERTYLAGKHALAAFAKDDMLVMMHMGVKRFTKYPMIDTISLRKQVAAELIKLRISTVSRLI